MDMIDRYLRAVRLLLPSRERDDIVAELREALIGRREAREAELGRPLTRDEDAALLRNFGNPIAVAGRYVGRQTLIGPELYPLYLLATTVLLAIALFSSLAGVGLALVAPSVAKETLGEALGSMLTGPLATVGASTIAFAVLDRTSARANILRVLDEWDPLELPAAPRRAPRARWPTFAAGVIVNLVVLVWWATLPDTGRWELPLKAGQILWLDFAPLWSTLHWPLAGLLAGAVAVNALELAGGAYRRTAFGVDLVVQLAAIAIAGHALGLGHWVAATGRGLTQHEIAEINNGIDIGARVTLIAVLLGGAGAMVYDGWRLWRGGRTAA